MFCATFIFQTRSKAFPVEYDFLSPQRLHTLTVTPGVLQVPL